MYFIQILYNMELILHACNQVFYCYVAYWLYYCTKDGIIKISLIKKRNAVSTDLALYPRDPLLSHHLI